MFEIKVLFVLVFLIGVAWTLEEGQSCVKDGAPGTCKKLRECQVAIDDIRRQKRPQHCTFVGTEPVVCCVSNKPAAPATPAVPIATTPAAPVATTPKRSTTTKAYVPQEYEYTEEDGGQCEPLDPQYTTKRTGNKSWDKCIEYQETLVYPCTSDAGLAADSKKSRNYNCGHETSELIIGGVSAAQGEFPHMALIGYGDQSDNLWLCGATLISDRFLLTAGHCISYRNYNASMVAVGVLHRAQIEQARTYPVAEIIRHPEYKPPMKYNDIALLKTRNQIKLDRYTVPACLPVSMPGAGKDERALATGWGTTEYRGDLAEIMQKVILNKFATNECSSKFPKGRLMPRGFDADTQICYGDKNKSKDTCQGDSGGPLQIHNKLLHCMYTIIGVTSFGKACGYIGDPGIYTRVQQYLPWIEPIVWG